jgi:hypothetical protein
VKAKRKGMWCLAFRGKEATWSKPLGGGEWRSKLIRHLRVLKGPGLCFR